VWGGKSVFLAEIFIYSLPLSPLPSLSYIIAIWRPLVQHVRHGRFSLHALRYDSFSRSRWRRRAWDCSCHARPWCGRLTSIAFTSKILRF
jgi:hypothetical protein